MVPSYLQCKRCGQIEQKADWIAKDGALECPHCEQSSSIAWPDPELSELLNFVLAFDHEQPRYSQVVSVFLASAFELLLEQLLSTMLYMDLSYEELSSHVDALLESHQGRSRMMDLYKRFGRSSFHEEATKLGFGDFLKNWDLVVAARNKVVHGRASEAGTLDPEMVLALIVEGLDIFSLLRNDYGECSILFKSAMEPIWAREHELEKMKKWNATFGGKQQDS